MLKKMRVSCNSETKEYIEAMLRMGMKVGEIQALFPNVSSATIHSMGKEMGINTRIRNDPNNIKNRNINAIQKLIAKSISEGYIKDTGKAHLLIEDIYSLADTPNGKMQNQGRVDRNVRNYIEAMLHMGMAPKRIHVLFPDVSVQSIWYYRKKIGMDAKTKEELMELEQRNLLAIKEKIESAVEEGYIVDSEQVEEWITILDSLADENKENSMQGKNKGKTEQKEREEEVR